MKSLFDKETMEITFMSSNRKSWTNFIRVYLLLESKRGKKHVRPLENFNNKNTKLFKLPLRCVKFAFGFCVKVFNFCLIPPFSFVFLSTIHACRQNTLQSCNKYWFVLLKRKKRRTQTQRILKRMYWIVISVVNIKHLWVTSIFIHTITVGVLVN